ncbi:hypothetical protein PoB_004542100 [Plakobranchus ocellatus]|uniref:Uncharacterized protein n=1 Tax=Plakobranchus ocellatus TaxID=259542 RepID=A0AAV4BJ23_9GAST|nr:hypothetical protein PoB_004542100 [Plakobranchus ocellatus]
MVTTYYSLIVPYNLSTPDDHSFQSSSSGALVVGFKPSIETFLQASGCSQRPSSSDSTRNISQWLGPTQITEVPGSGDTHPQTNRFQSSDRQIEHQQRLVPAPIISIS